LLTRFNSTQRIVCLAYCYQNNQRLRAMTIQRHAK
jgi:hypothetical protein